MASPNQTENDEAEDDDPTAAFAAGLKGDLDAVAAAEVIAGEILTPPPAGAWRENATRLYFDSAIKLEWNAVLGDYESAPVASATMRDGDETQTIRIAVPPMNDFYLRSSSGNYAWFGSREGAASVRPRLIVNGRTFNATRDTMLSTSTVRPQGASRQLSNRHGLLVAFDGYTPRAGDRVELQLSTTAIRGNHVMTVHRPDVHFELPTIPETRSDPTVVAEMLPATITRHPQVTVSGGIATSTISGTALNWFNARLGVPSADEYYSTTVIKLGGNWPNRGGKLPGLANTGQAQNTAGVRRIIDGVECSNSGWGGKSANGCRWSARTGWYGRSGDLVGLATYFYAVQPMSVWGVGESFPMPGPVGKWFALVQRVRVNSVGEADGMLSYWLCIDSGCYPQYHRDDIVWRRANLAEAKINEIWNNIYCGGTSCGGSLPPTSAQFRRMTVTRGLPDLVALTNEVRSLNR